MCFITFYVDIILCWKQQDNTIKEWIILQMLIFNYILLLSLEREDVLKSI
jgi:hypothetical protein